jgi:hypothetical protein
MSEATEPGPDGRAASVEHAGRDGGADGRDEPLVAWQAVLTGALVGLAVLVTASIVGALLDRNLTNYDESGWRSALFVVVLVGYLSAGFLAGRRAPTAALSNGALAGTFAFVAWVPIRVVIWIARDEHKGLFTGPSPVFRPGQVFGHLVIASALGMLGGFLGARLVVRRVEQ